MNKKLISLLTVLSIIMSMLGTVTVFADKTGTGLDEVSALKLGDYVQMGTYYSQPILWRCAAFEKIKGYESDGTPIIDSTDTVTEYQDGYLPLMLSDKIICFKAFDAATNLNSTAGSNSETGSHSRRKRPTTTSSNYWADSNIRSWLNSEAGEGEVEWLCGNPPHQDDWNNVLWGGYENEAGFLTNFLAYEKMAIKTTSQKSIVAGSDKDLDGVTGNALHKYEFGMSKIVQNYDEAYSEQVKDTIFLPDIKQIDTVYKNGTTLGTDYFIPYPTEEAATFARNHGVSTIAGVEQWKYMLRTPYCADPDKNDTSIRDVCNLNNGFVGTASTSFGSEGVRPAFFLDLSSVSFKAGDGTSDNPYAKLSAEDITEISTLTELEAFRDSVNNGNTYEGKTVTLTADIDMSEKYGKGKESWASIGTPFKLSFMGTFEGGGHKITNLYINDTGYGLFGSVSGTVKELGVEGYMYATFDTAGSMGGITADLSGTIERCFFSGSIEGNSHIGGIAGSNTGQIIDCYNTGTITAQEHCGGGITGTGEMGALTRCYNVGTITKPTSEHATPAYGSITGGGFNTALTDCYYLEGTHDNGAYLDEGEDTTTALTAEQFADKANFANWDFDTVWDMDERLGRPVLRSKHKYDYSIKYENEKAIVTVPQDGTYTVIFAAYDNDILLSVNAQNVQLVKGENPPISLQGFNVNGKIKVMLWYGLESMQPCCENSIKQLNIS